MSSRILRIAYVPMTDAAPIIIACDLGFAAEEGLTLDLVQARSWAQVRDLLAAGVVEGAHMLAPMAVARAMGLGPALPPVEVLMFLSQGGQMIGAARALTGKVPPGATPTQMAQALRAAGPPRLRIGVPYTFSTHALLAWRWLGDGIDVRTVPPPLMGEALERAEIDLFCVGEPWGSVAAQGTGVLLTTGRAVWASAPEKVLAARAGWADAQPDLAGALMRAVWRAGRWLDQGQNRETAAEILARADHLDLPVELVEAALTDRFDVPLGGGRFMAFHDGTASFPWKSTGALMASLIAGRFGLPQGPAMAAAKAVFRTDLYRQHLRSAGADLPGASMKVEGTLSHPSPVASERGNMILGPDRFFDDWVFEPPAD